MSEPIRGVLARVTFDYAPSGRDLEPKRVEHLQFGITWDVTGILDRWAHPGRADDTLGKATLIKWWLLKVAGPLPGCPAELGEFIMEVSFHGDPPGWWISPPRSSRQHDPLLHGGRRHADPVTVRARREARPRQLGPRRRRGTQSSGTRLSGCVRVAL